MHYLSQWQYFVFTFLTMVVLLIGTKAYKIRQKKLPLKYRRVKSPQKLPKRDLFHRDAFTEKKIGGDPDYIVIGSGIGGLASAAMLSRLGWKVLVLEQHDRAGGCMHVFEDHGYEFDTGVHYVGKTAKYAPRLNSLCKGKIKWRKLGSKEDHYTYDRVIMGSQEPFLWRPLVWKEDLIHRFPKEKEAIEKFAKACQTFMSGPTELWGLSKVFGGRFGDLVMRFTTWFWPEVGMNYKELLDSWTHNNELKQIICGNFGDVGLLPKDASSYVAIGVHQHYMPEGGFYPIGGPDAITKAMIPVIERAGGRVLVKAQVTQIVVSSHNAAMGVKVKKGSKEHMIRATKGVISAIGYCMTNKLTEFKLPALPKSLTAPSVQHITVFLGFKGSQDELKLPSCNYWVFPGMEKEEAYGDFVSKMHDEFCQKGRGMGFIGFPSSKDPDFARRFPGKSTAVCIAELPWSLVSEWKDEKVDHRSDEYQGQKKKWAEHMLQTCFWPHFSHLKDKLDYMKVGTPLSSAYYLGKESGESCGLSFSVERFTNSHRYLRPETPVHGLWLTGQDITTAGWAGALGAAEFTVGSMIGYYDLPAIISGKTLWKDLQKLPSLSEKDFATEYDLHDYEKFSGGGTET